MILKSFNYPIISIIVATYNSEKTLEKTLKSIEKQTYPQEKLEILVFDGGSKDRTLEIARKFKCKIIPNPKVEDIYAKHTGFLLARGHYLMFLDSDEVLENPNSLRIRYSIFKKYPKVKGIMTTGYKTPSNYSFINHYINEIGDPFSFFNYRLSQDARFYIKLLLKRYKVIINNEDAVLFDFSKVKYYPIIELMAAGGMIDLHYTRKNFPKIKSHPELIPFLFYLLVQNNALIGVTKNDKVIHYSSSSLQKYLKKISSRVKNNTFQTTRGKAGFLGRQKYQPKWFKIKQYLFLPYSFTIIFPLIDATIFSLTRRKFIYYIHVPLCIYTSTLILYYQLLKYVRIKPIIKTYGQ